MYYYKIYGLYIDSDYEFSELFPIDKPTYTDIHIKNTDLSHMLNTNYENASFKDKFCHICDYRDSIISYIFPCQGVFIIKDGDTIEYYLTKTCSHIFVTHFLLCFCFGAILRQRNILTLHGSGILYNNKMISVSGESGSGKSSLADGLLAKGGYFLADDAIALSIENKNNQNIFIANPTMPFRKLCTDALKNYDLNKLIKLESSEKNKYALLIEPKDFYNVPTPLDAIFIIEKSPVDAPAIREITGSDKLTYIVKNLYQKKIYDNLGLKKELFTKCILLANCVPIYVISRPLTGYTVNEQIELIEKTI